MEQWEYLTTFIDADSKTQSLELRELFRDSNRKFAAFTPLALMPALNEYGAHGWELITCHPYFVGDNLDVMTHNVAGAGTFRGNVFTHRYFCVFKRRTEAA